jgi:TFIIF-interacting CTD phosphatase-like protein
MSGYLVKDLSVLRRPLKQMLLVDDIAGSALAHPMNLVRIKPWMGDLNDRVLLDHLLPLLESVAVYSDVVSHMRQRIVKGNNRPVAGFPVLAI